MAFQYHECPDCGWDCILPESDRSKVLHCPLCAEDNGHDVVLTTRPVATEDRPEGFDSRND